MASPVVSLEPRLRFLTSTSQKGTMAMWENVFLQSRPRKSANTERPLGLCQKDSGANLKRLALAKDGGKNLGNNKEFSYFTHQ